MKKLFLLAAVLFTTLAAKAQNPVRYTFKNVDTANLEIFVYNPENFNPAKKHEAIIFYFGGGWSGFNIDKFIPQAKYFASRGMVAIVAEYRTLQSHGVTPDECVKDAKASMRYLRANAKELGIDPKKIVASGGSAGGHLAAATAFCKGFNHADDDLTVDCRPNAMVLFNPVIDNSEQGYGYAKVKDMFPAISPMHNITKNAPPTLFMVGTRDEHVPTATAQKYKELMEEAGARCDLIIYDGQKHGFFNWRGETGDNTMYNQTVSDTDDFLVSLKYLKKKK